MKKLLILSTALVSVAGMAAADISMSGYGRFGVAHDSAAKAADERETAMVSRLRMNIDGSTTTDAGVTFSARIRAQADSKSNGGAGTAQLNGARFSVSTNSFHLDAGNAGGAIDNLNMFDGYEPGLTYMVGQYSGMDYDHQEYTSSGAGDNGLYAAWTGGAFGAAVSFRQGEATADADLQELAGSLSYTYDNFVFAVGYSQAKNVDYELANGNALKDNARLFVATGEYNAGPLGATVFLGNEKYDNAALNDEIGGTFYGLSGAYEVSNALTLIASYGDGNGSQDVQSYGLGATYALADGVELRGGVARTKQAGETDTLADLGVEFAF